MKVILDNTEPKTTSVVHYEIKQIKVCPQITLNSGAVYDLHTIIINFNDKNNRHNFLYFIWDGMAFYLISALISRLVSHFEEEKICAGETKDEISRVTLAIKRYINDILDEFKIKPINES